MKKIAVISQNRDFFGAQIVHIPLLRALREMHLDSDIAFFSRNKISSILLDLKEINKLIIENSKADFLKKYVAFSPDITINLRKNSGFHILSIILFNRGEKVGFSGFLSKFFFSSTKISDTSIYRAENYLSLVNKKLKYRKVNTKHQIVLIPGAGGEHKMWNIDNYVSLAHKLKDQFALFKIVFIFGEKERSLSEKTYGFETIINPDVQKLFRTIEESYLVITNDCGPSHIAHISCVNVISIILKDENIKDENKREWINTDRKTRIIESKTKESINTISVEEVYEKAAEILKELEESPAVFSNKVYKSAAAEACLCDSSAIFAYK